MFWFDLFHGFAPWLYPYARYAGSGSRPMPQVPLRSNCAYKYIAATQLSDFILATVLRM